MNHTVFRKAPYILLPCISLFLFLACKPGDKAAADAHPTGLSYESMADKAQLERDVAKLLEGDEVVLRRGVEKVFALAQLREQEGKDKEAIQLYESALRVNASNIPNQMRLASLLARHERSKEAVTCAKTVQEMAEDESLVRDAEKLLKFLGHSPKEVEPKNEVDDKAEIVLIPLGDVNVRLASSLRDVLIQRMGIRFTVYQGTKILSVGKPDRTFKTVITEDYFKMLKERLGEEKFRAVTTELGFTAESLESSAGKLKFIQSLLENSGADGQKALTQINAEMTKADKQMQYDAGRLLRELQAQFPLQKKSRIKGYLAVSSEDIFADGSRFVFGSSQPGYGVMSIRRFSSDYTGEDQNRPRLLKRALKQALSSANLVLGILRCTNPDCARAYPHSLPELDQKPDVLCSLCRERLSAFRQSKQ